MATLMTCEPTDDSAGLMESEFAESAIERQLHAKTGTTLEQHLLITRAQHGERGAFEDIFNQYSGLMLHVAYSIVRDRDMAEDAVQNALIQAWQHLPSLREAGALRSWLMRIVVNQCISFKRRLARSTLIQRQSISEQETVLASQIADHAKGTKERDWDLAQAIKQLPTKQQMVIALHYYQGMTVSEISQALQISENIIKKRIQAALSNLRQVIKDVEIEESHPRTRIASQDKACKSLPA
jgi:RNA polymerase sigma-70 factor, ECF subfamily